ncbi:MAG: hypothetical protein KatS3mg061_2168 [Dehalococcoidia bacterium]|nr:MAG: hypothetical protein KatS3mg061_2168 [Dehalococcoidia bacterium]
MELATPAIRRQYLPTSLGQVHLRRAGAGKPVVLVHNTYLSSEGFTRGGFLAGLAERYAVIAPDTLGQGHSDLPPRLLTLPEYAANLAEVITGLGVERASVVGSHTGASIALELAVSRPELVERLVLLGLPLWTAEERTARAQLPRFRPWASEPSGQYLLTLWNARLAITAGLTPREIHTQFLEFLEPGPRVHEPLWALFAYEPRERLPHLQVPTLALAGAEDPFRRRLDEIAALVPGIETAVLPAGVVMHGFSPAPLLERLAAFLG